VKLTVIHMVKTFSALYRDLRSINYAVHYNHSFSHMNSVYIHTTSSFLRYILIFSSCPHLRLFPREILIKTLYSTFIFLMHVTRSTNLMSHSALRFSGPFKVYHSVTPLLFLHSQLQLTHVHPFITDNLTPCGLIFYPEDGGSSFLKTLATIY